MQQGQDRVFAGIRATGRQHIGNYLGAIQNFVALQDRYECIYSIVDLHSLTTLTDTEQLRDNVRETAIDLLAAGIRPEETILYAQSHVPEISELHLLLSMVTPIGRLMNVPTFKEKGEVAARERQLRTGRIPRPADRRHRALPSQQGAGRRGPAAPPGAGP